MTEDGFCASFIAQADFVDLHIGDHFCDVTGLNGAASPRSSVPEEWKQEVEDIRLRCKATLDEHGDPEFSISYSGVLFRVTQLPGIDGDVFFLRRSQAEIRKPEKLGIPALVMGAWRDPALSGLVLICGKMKNGKTSSAAGLVVDRLTKFGGLCVAIEDPPETPLSGEHGAGRCVQVHASRKKGGYKEQLIRALRTSAEFIFLGEIRDTPTAAEAINASINGHLILATLHADSPAECIERLINLAEPIMPNAAHILASGLSVVMTQQLTRLNDGGGRLNFTSLVLTGNDTLGARQMIRDGKTELLPQIIQQQESSQAWNARGN